MAITYQAEGFTARGPIGFVDGRVTVDGIDVGTAITCVNSDHPCESPGAEMLPAAEGELIYRRICKEVVRG